MPFSKASLRSRLSRRRILRVVVTVCLLSRGTESLTLVPRASVELCSGGIGATVCRAADDAGGACSMIGTMCNAMIEIMRSERRVAKVVCAEMMKSEDGRSANEHLVLLGQRPRWQDTDKQRAHKGGEGVEGTDYERSTWGAWGLTIGAWRPSSPVISLGRLANQGKQSTHACPWLEKSSLSMTLSVALCSHGRQHMTWIYCAVVIRDAKTAKTLATS